MNKPRPPDQRIPQQYRFRRILAYSHPVQGGSNSPWQPHASSMSDQPYYLKPVGLAWGVVGVLLVFFLLALCGSGANTSARKAAGQSRPHNGEVAAQQEKPAQEAVVIEEPKTNTTSTAVNITSSKEREMIRNQAPLEMTRNHESLEMNHVNTSDKETEKRVRALSSPHSLDPLPEVPKLELAGETSKAARKDDDYEDFNPYDVVPGELAERMSDSEGERNSGGSPQRDIVDPPHCIPYGKVSRHIQLGEQEMDDGDSYAEVRNVVRHGPFTHNDQLHTSPVHEDEVKGFLWDKRCNTDSATHMPLPQIPSGTHEVVISMTYDRIPEDTVVKNKPPRVPKQLRHCNDQEQLYESMDEVGEKDLYESVPDDLTKVDSPGNLRTPTISHKKLLDGGAASPVPHSSPLPINRGVDVKKKNLDKTLSTSFEDSKRRFSFFGRKKTVSVSSSKVKRGELGSPTPSTSSPVHKSPPLPNIPAPFPPIEDYEEVNYDRMTPGQPPKDNAFQQAFLVNDTNAKPSLPYRSGALPHPPLPKLPNDTGSGTVVHKRVIEADEYDIVVHEFPTEIPDEPNYDTVNLPPPDIKADPPYDRVDKEKFIELREKEIAARKKLATEIHPYRADSDELQELGKARKESEALVTASGSQSLETGSTATRAITPEGEVFRCQPEHDEEGYAMVPHEFKMRKRALSASRIKCQELEQEYNPFQRSYSLESTSPLLNSPTSPKSSEDQYASINMQTKRERQHRELEALREQDELRAYTGDHGRSSSPFPPPLPPPPRPEDLDGFEEIPPIPAHQLVDWDEGPNSRQQLLDSSDPPYAKVKSKAYAAWDQPKDLDEIPPIPAHWDEGPNSRQQLLDNSDPPYAKVKSKVNNPYAAWDQPNDLDEIPPIPAQLAVQQMDGGDEGSNSHQQVFDSSDPPYAKVRNKVDNVYAVVSQPEGLDEIPRVPVQLAVYQQDAEPNSPHQLLDSSDPPYAKVKSKVDNLYAVVCQTYAQIDLDTQKGIGDVGLATVVGQASVGVMDEAAGYDIIIEAKSISSTKDKPYDTIADIRRDKSQYEQELPTLETWTGGEMDKLCNTLTDSIRGDIIAKTNLCQDNHQLSMLETVESNNLYDCLLPENPTKKTPEVSIDLEPQRHDSRSM